MIWSATMGNADAGCLVMQVQVGEAGAGLQLGDSGTGAAGLLQL